MVPASSAVADMADIGEACEVAGREEREDARLWAKTQREHMSIDMMNRRDVPVEKRRTCRQAGFRDSAYL
jgi:hypothetical protein